MTANPDGSRQLDASMALLNFIQQETVDPEYASFSAAHPNLRKNLSAWQNIAIGLLAGLLITTYALSASSSTTAAVNERNELITQLNVVTERNTELKAQADAITSQINQLETQLVGDKSQQATNTAIWAGAQAVTGPGVQLTIEENPRNQQGLIVDQDLRQVVNGFWAAGAEAISINGHRLSAQTAIRQAGSAVTVDYRSISSPFIIAAIGDPTELNNSFIKGSGGSWLTFLAQNYQVSWRIDQQSKIQLSADSGLSTRYAQQPNKPK